MKRYILSLLTELFSHREGVRLKVFQSNSDYFNFCNRTLQVTQARFTLTESTVLKVNMCFHCQECLQFCNIFSSL